ncbi:hypothetical protein OH733_27360 [Streptomyces griseus]|uniref:hypothetical protein n=1 Tax=Streptomyces griseus TaxID=1911 RepID=UPI003866A482|nr:hypothetical protein OG554_11070 [Streptomyces fimicarius]WTC90211.1 hypothetical protein OH733_27360 [Streptomyces griseus]WTD67159.1 hypothetical protein OH763_09635 [Streptomyces griseus]
MKRNELAKQALSHFGRVVWFRSPVERNPNDGKLQVAFVGWRFAEPREDIREILDSIVQETTTKVEWEFRSAKNWMIVPRRLILEAGPAASKFNEAMVAISQSDQRFCAESAADLEKILHRLSDEAVSRGL